MHTTGFLFNFISWLYQMNKTIILYTFRNQVFADNSPSMSSQENLMQPLMSKDTKTTMNYSTLKSENYSRSQNGRLGTRLALRKKLIRKR